MSDTLQKQTVLIPGGSGFIGSAVIPKLLSRGHSIIATFCHHEPINKSNPNLRWIQWDATKRYLPEVNWAEIDSTLYLSTFSEDLWNFPSNAKSLYQVNVDSIFLLLEKACEYGIKRVVIASTGDVLSGNIRIAAEEDVSYLPVSFYGVTKACAELLTNAYSNVISTAVLRYFHPYGLGGERFLINRLALAVKEGKEISIEGEDGITISPVHLNDAAQGTALALESLAEGIFHLAGPDTLSLKSFLELVGKLTGQEPDIKSIPQKTAGVHAASFTRSRELLGYTPQISLETGLKKILKLSK